MTQHTNSNPVASEVNQVKTKHTISSSVTSEVNKTKHNRSSSVTSEVNKTKHNRSSSVTSEVKMMKPKSANTVSRPLPAWLRFYLYGMHGLLDEIMFTAIFDAMFEPQGNAMLKGYSTIFSFFIYGSCSFFVERVYVFLYLKHGIKWYIRLPLYLLILYTWEFTFGLVLRQFDACSWDYSHYPLNVMGLITLVYAPLWLIVCMYMDVIFHFLLSLRITTEVHDDDLIHLRRKLD